MARTHQQRSKGQTRRISGKWGSGYSDEKLYLLVEKVLLSADPIDPTSVSQPRFDLEAPSVAAREGWEKPPKANGITMRLKKPWQQIKDEAVGDRDIQQVLARADGVEMGTWFDERNVHFALRRVALHLDKETLFPHEYHRGRAEIIEQTKRTRAASPIEDLLPTRGQLLWFLEGKWDDGLRIAEMPLPTQGKARGHDLLKLAEHLYETKERLPTSLHDLRNHAIDLNISYPRRAEIPIDDLIDQLIADRAARKLPTPDSGPAEGARLDAAAIAALIGDAPKPLPAKGHWDKERVVEAFADFVELFDGKWKLNLALYTSHRSEHGWPGNNAWQRHGKFQELVEAGREQAMVRRKRAA